MCISSIKQSPAIGLTEGSAKRPFTQYGASAECSMTINWSESFLGAVPHEGKGPLIGEHDRKFVRKC